MILTMVQNCPKKGALSENLADLDRLLEKAEVGSLVLLPELFATSYLLHPDELGAEDYAVIVKWMKEKRDRNGACDRSGVHAERAYRSRDQLHPKGDPDGPHGDAGPSADAGGAGPSWRVADGHRRQHCAGRAAV